MFGRKVRYVYFVRYTQRLKGAHETTALVTLDHQLNDTWSLDELAKSLNTNRNGIKTLTFLHEV